MIWLILIAILSAPACAQFMGYNSPQGTVVPAFTAVSTPQVTAPLRNLGQTIHFMTYTVSGGTPNLIQIRLDGSYDNLTWFAISDDGTDLTQGEVLAIGYFPFVRANLLQCQGCSGSITLTANYSGTSSVSGNGLGVYNPSQQIRKVVLTRASAGTTATVSGIVAPYGSTAGVIVALSNGTLPANSTIKVFPHVGEVAPGNVLANALPTPLNTYACIRISALPATSVDVRYTAGGASSSLISMYYIFYQPGTSQPPMAQPAFAQNQESVSAAGALVAQTIDPFSAQGNVYLFSVSARCSAGTSSLTVADSSNTLWTSAPGEVGTTTFRFQWAPGLTTSAQALAMTITLASCGVGNTGTLDVQASVF